ncbi:MAG TPA: magnesium transporter CorA family protein [Jatrophihabitans sp.]|nr:magnesium transporter CorA family protein [Jatrophihabitans sp.]
MTHATSQRTHASWRTALWHDGVLEKEDFPFGEISDYLEKPGYLIWVDLIDPDARLLAQLGEELSLDPLAIEDAVAHYERPKVSRYRSHTFLTAYSLRLNRETGELEDEQVSAFVLDRAFVTVHSSNWHDADAVMRRWKDNGDLISCGTRSLAWGLLDVLVDTHFDVVQALDDEIESLEDILFEQDGRSGHVQRRTFALRKSLVHCRRAVLPMREVVNTLMRRDIDIDPHLRPYFEDLYDHVLRAAEWTESLRDMVSSVFETNLSLQDARLNSIMKKLTAYTALIAIPTAVTGFYGQNVPYPGFGHHNGYLTSLTIIVVLCTALVVVFRRKDWL